MGQVGDSTFSLDFGGTNVQTSVYNPEDFLFFLSAWKINGSLEKSIVTHHRQNLLEHKIPLGGTKQNYGSLQQG